MVKAVTLPNHIMLDDGLQQFSLQLQDGARGFTEGGSSASTLGNQGGGGRYGDFEPAFAQVEQRTWNGGRGNEAFVDDQTRFFDSRSLHTTTASKLHLAPQWSFAQGLRTVDEYDVRPRDMSWMPLFGNTRYISVSFAASASYSADKAHVWVRRRGSPGTLTLELCADSSGDPGTVNKTVTKTVTDITDVVSEFITFDWTSTQSLTSATTYHLKIYGASGDSASSHWEIGVNAGAGSGGKYSSAGSSWTSATWKPYYRITGADTARRFLHFELEGGHYAVSVNDDLSASVVYINGDRGTASAGSTTSLTNSSRTWTVDQWAGARVKIIGGTGKGLNSVITSNTATVLTLTTTLPYALDNTSRYVIYATPYWTTASIGTTGLGAVKDVAVLNNVAYFAQGGSTNVRRARSNANTHDWADDSTNKADILYPFYDAADGPQMWRYTVSDGNISRANKQDWGTALTFRTGIPAGRLDYLVTNMIDYNNTLYVFKEDSVWTVFNDRLSRVNMGIEGLPDKDNGSAAASNGMFLFFSFWKSMERLYGGTIDDVGVWHDSGLPEGRTGKVAAIEPLLAWLFVALDAGSGTSSVLSFLDRGWHEIYRAHDAALRVCGIFSQNNDDANPYLWVDVGGELVYMEFSLTPLRDSGFAFAHEGVLVSATYDFGHTNTYKFFEELALDTENLDRDGIRVGVDWQAGDDVNTSTWVSATDIAVSPKDSASLNVGEKTKIRFRLRLMSDDGEITPVIFASVLKGFEVMPVKRVWNLRVKVSSILNAGRAADPDDLYLWLWEASKKARKVRLHSVIPNVNNIYVKLEPPTTTWNFINRASKWTGVFYLTLREL